MKIDELGRWCEQTRALGEMARGNRGFVPVEAFYALSDATVTVPVEVLPIRASEKCGAEVLFTRRPESDPFFAGQMHTPGGMLRVGLTPEAVLEETVRAEVTSGQWEMVKQLPIVSVPRGTARGECPRGQYLCIPHIIVVQSGNSPCKSESVWADWRTPPEDLVSYQAVHLLPLVQNWLRSHWMAE